MRQWFRRHALSLVCGLTTWVVLIGLWEGAARIGQGAAVARVFPPPSIFLAELFRSNLQIGIGSQAATLWQSIGSSLFRVFMGLGIGFVVALVFGVLVSSSVWLKRFLMPVIQVLAPIAPIAWIPLALVLFGIGNQTAIFLVFMGVFFTLSIATTAAIDTVPEEYVNVARLLGAGKVEIWLRVVFPHILPAVFTMLRLNFIAAWMAVLAAEMTGLRDGLGAVIMVGRNLFDNKVILLGMFLIGVCGFLVDLTLSMIQNRFFWWNRGAR
jgi:NitT/TauT family transport system permease protein